MGAFFTSHGDLVKEGQILNFYKPFIYKNFVMNFRVSELAGFAGCICSLDVIKVTRTYVGKKTNFRFFMRTFFVRPNR